jgi:hypothetical protein
MDTEEPEDFLPEKEKVAIYSKWAILGFSVFFSPFVGCILLMLNFRRIGNKAAGYLILLFGIVYMITAEVVLIKLAGLDIAHITPEKLIANQKILYYSKALDILGGAILAEYFFKRYFKGDGYTSRSIFPPLLIMIAILFLFGFL